MSFNSKYSGQQVENMLDQVANGNAGGGGGGITTETDPIFSASPAAKITDGDIEEWNSKQDVIADLTTIRDGASKGATALQEEQYKGTVTSVTAGEGLAGGIITGSGTISLAKKMQNYIHIDLMDKVDILKIGNTFSDTNITIDKTSYVWVDKMLNFDKFGRFDSIDGYYYYPTKVTFGEATTSLKGLMSASDKAKLDGIDLTGKQDKLVSGTNIKTINGESILGSGNIVVEGGSGDSSEEVYVWYLDNVSDGTISLQVYEKLKTVKTIIGVINSTFYHASSRIVFRGNIAGLTLSTISTNVVISYNFSFHEIEDGYDYISELYSYAIIENYIRVEHGTSDTIFTLTPNTFHVWDEVAALDLSFADEQAGVANEYTFQFTSGATPTSLTLPDTIQWVNGAPNIEANKTYQVSIINNIGLIVSV